MKVLKIEGEYFADLVSLENVKHVFNEGTTLCVWHHGDAKADCVRVKMSSYDDVSSTIEEIYKILNS